MKYQLVKIVPADETHREFSYQVKKAAMGGYITRIWGWDEEFQKKIHSHDWQQKRAQIILYNNKPIGTIRTVSNEDSLEIEQFYILPEYQNKGIGSYLLKDILDDADKAGLPAKLAVLKINPAISLYRRHGFETTSTNECQYLMERKPGAGVDTNDRNTKRYKAVIFDLFGTIIDNFSRAEYYSVLEEMAAILNAPYDKFHRIWLDSFPERVTGVHATQKESIEYICHELNVKATETQKKHAFQVRLEYTKRSVRPRPEALEVLAQLKKEGYKIGLISDCSGEIPMVWGNTPFVPFFNVTVFSCVAGVKKPDPRIYRMATDQLKVNPRDCLYIGDGSSQELTGAKQAGMTPVLIRDPNDSPDAHYIDREDDWAGLKITSLKEVLTLVK